MPAVMFCSQCGNALQSNALFCTGCGARAIASVAAPSAPAPQRITISNPYRGKAMQVLGVIVGAFAVLALFGVMGNDDPHPAASIFAVVLAVVGGGLYIGGKATHWYHAE